MKSVEKSRLVVTQPPKLEGVLQLLQTFENLNARVSERTGEDRSQDLGGAGGAAGGTQQTGQGSSPRDQAIQQMPSDTKVLQERLTQHIRRESRKLEHIAKTVSRQSGPGTAHKLNELYAKIRRLNALIVEILEASIEILKRLFIRVFIDQQPIL